MSDSEVALLPCPLCGGTKGYGLSEGNTYRWWTVHCSACGEQVAECNSDRRMEPASADNPLPTRWPAADEAWNDAAAYAHGLRERAAKAESELAELKSSERERLIAAVVDSERAVQTVLSSDGTYSYTAAASEVVRGQKAIQALESHERKHGR